MRIVWDEPRRRKNLAPHGLDFGDAELCEWDWALVRASYVGSRGERRLLAILPFSGRLVAIAFAPLGTEAISIISMRPASRRERTCMPKLELPPVTDDEEARIQAGIAADPDNPEWTAEDFRNARPFGEVCPELAASARRMRGAQKASTKEAVSIRLSRDVLARLRAGGPGWQTRVDEMLRKAVGL